MVKREIVLLIGNGFNRTIDDDYYSSENLLIHLAENKKDFNCKEIIKKRHSRCVLNRLLVLNLVKKQMFYLRKLKII